MNIFKKLMRLGTPAHKLASATAPDTSIAAAQTVDTRTLEEMVYDAVTSFGASGCTQDDVLDLRQFKGRPYSSVTARFKSLIDKNYIYDTGERRIGHSGKKQRVLVSQIHKK